MDLNKSKERAELLKLKIDIEEQISYPNECKIREVFKDISRVIGPESFTYEFLSVGGDLSQLTSADNLSFEQLYNKLPKYLDICNAKISGKVLGK